MSEGLLANPGGRGFRVPALVRREVGEAQPLLEALEPLALKSAGEPARAQLRELERLTEKMTARGDDPARWNELDTRWHRALPSRCPNARLGRYIEELRHVLRRFELACLGGLEDMTSSWARRALRRSGRSRAWGSKAGAACAPSARTSPSGPGCRLRWPSRRRRSPICRGASTFCSSTAETFPGTSSWS